MSEWQPIETAPKDGTRILVAGNGRVDIAHWEKDVSEVLVAAYPNPYWQECDNSSWFLLGEKWFEPTHWMALPNPPSTSND